MSGLTCSANPFTSGKHLWIETSSAAALNVLPSVLIWHPCLTLTRAWEEIIFDFDDELKGTLANMPPPVRIKVCRGLLVGEFPCLGGDADVNRDSKLMFKDAQEIRAILALALTECGCHRDACQVWVQIAQCAVQATCPPFDEALCSYTLHAAFCAAGISVQVAMPYLRVTRALHHMCFGGQLQNDAEGVKFFLCHYGRELDLIRRLSPQKKVRLRQHRLAERLESSCTPNFEPLTWEELCAAIMSWEVST